MKQKIIYKFINIIIFILIILGLGIFFYPNVCHYLYQREVKKINKFYLERIDNYDNSDLEDLYNAIKAYNQELYESKQVKLVDAFSYEQVDFSLLEFGFNEEIIGYLDIPNINVVLPVYLGASKTNIDRGAAHLTQSSLPIGGNNTNSVIVAHRGMVTAEMFRHLDKLEIGDKIYFTNFYEELVYSVYDIKIIDPDDINAILIQSGKDLLTLMTCHPYGADTSRYLVFAKRLN